jgi:predicted solute-binding protein
MKKSKNIQLDDAIQNADKYIKQMVTMDDKKLSKHLDLFRQQMQMAYDQGNHKAFELLQEYERQVIISRMKKNFKS